MIGRAINDFQRWRTLNWKRKVDQRAKKEGNCGVMRKFMCNAGKKKKQIPFMDIIGH